MMKTLLLATAAAFALGMSTAYADERIALTDGQMDSVTAGFSFFVDVVTNIDLEDNSAQAEAEADAFGENTFTATFTDTFADDDESHSFSASFSAED